MRTFRNVRRAEAPQEHGASPSHGPGAAQAGGKEWGDRALAIGIEVIRAWIASDFGARSAQSIEAISESGAARSASNGSSVHAG